MCAKRRSSGQALLETIIVLPVLVFVILGAIQLMLVAHARVMTHYAAYCAARAGIVHNANWNVMRNAALIAALPVYARTDDLSHFLVSWAKVKAAAEITEAVDTGMASVERMLEGLWDERIVNIEGVTADLSLIDINVASPEAEAFTSSTYAQDQAVAQQKSLDPGGPDLMFPEGGREIDFDDVPFLHNYPAGGRLAVQVRLLYPMRIPVVGRILFELWLAQELLDVERVHSDMQEWLTWQGRAEGGKASGGDLEDEIAGARAEGLGEELLKIQWAEEVRMLRYIGSEFGIYLLPLKASYAMQMQSNPFLGNQKEPVWFTRAKKKT
jgi:hypothetical protein